LAKNVFRFTDFHGHQAARPRGWPLRMTSGKVRKDQANRDITFDTLAGGWRIFQVHIIY
jgi:hypothetical protein